MSWSSIVSSNIPVEKEQVAVAPVLVKKVYKPSVVCAGRKLTRYQDQVRRLMKSALTYRSNLYDISTDGYISVKKMVDKFNGHPYYIGCKTADIYTVVRDYDPGYFLLHPTNKDLIRIKDGVTWIEYNYSVRFA